MMKYEIVNIDDLRPLEKVFPTHLLNLEKTINRDDFIAKAIIADKETGIVLDGSHRYVYFLKNGFKTVPVCWVNYNDESIRVGSKLLHRFLIDDDLKISKAECRSRGLAGKLFPPRTTRHFFTFRKEDIVLPLKRLKRGAPVDVSELIANVEIDEEIAHNKKYIEEIDEEIETVIQYLLEVKETKNYLREQILSMNSSKEIAFFPGKFHPPHIGHLCSILNILPHYKKVIIGVTEDVPKDIQITTVKEIKSIWKSIFKDYENIKVCIIKGILCEKENMEGLPKFDVLLSGNLQVLNWAQEHQIKSKYVARFDGYCGTEIRSRFKEK